MGGGAGAGTDSTALSIEPVLVLRRCPGNMQSLQQGATIEIEGLLRFAVIEGAVERGRVTPKHLLRHSDLLVTPSGENAGTELRPQEIEGAAERGAGVLLVQVWPEKPQQRVSSMKAARGGNSEIGDQPQPLRLLQHGTQFHPVGTTQVEAAQGV